MSDSVLLIVGTAIISALLTWLWTEATARWRRGRGLLTVPDRVERENFERLLKAKADRNQGWRELWRSLLEFTLAAVVVGLVCLLAGGLLR